MMKKLLLALLILFTIPVWAETVAPENDNLFFNDEVVKTAIVEFVPEDKQESVANLYEELMNQTTGQISIEKLFMVCRVAGFNSYRVDGFNKCRQFIEKLVADSELMSDGLAGGFCPGLREDGTNPNNLRSITDQTRVGDFCSSTQIAAGEVIFNGIRRGREEYACTCLATACLPGFSFNNGVKTVSGMCQTIIANENGQCLREEHAKSPQNDNTQKCKDFCAKRYEGKGCSFTSVIMSHSTGQCICNPGQGELDVVAQSMKDAERQRLANLPYYEVCGVHRGKSGGREICEDKIFNWTNVGQLQAAGLAREFARVRYGDTIQCDTKYRKSGNDDWIKCVSINSGTKTYYEFKFDDVKESIDADIRTSLVDGICLIHNLAITDFGCTSTAAECSGKLAQSAQQFGYSTTYRGNICVVSDRRINPDDAEEKLAKIDGIDNRVFFHGIQIQGSQTIVNKLETYIIGQGKTVDTFTCDYGVGKINAGGILGNSDDILRCYLNGQPIDFVFDDFSESWLYVQEAGESGIQCIVNGGVYQGSNCHGLSQTQCTQMDVAIKKEFPGISGTKWENGMCVLRDARQAAAYDIMVNVGVGIVAAADCVLLTHTGCVILAVELAGLATEISTQIAIGGRAADFIKESIQCKSRECAKHTLTNLTGKVLSVKSSLKPQDLHAVDSELARLVGLLEPEDLSQDVSGAEWEDIVRQLGGDPTDIGGTALVVANKIGLVMQFASIGTSALRLTGRAIATLGAKSARMSNIGTVMVRAANNADGVRAAAAASAINDAANTAGDGARAAGNTANAAGDASRAASNAANAAENARVFNNVEDAGRAFASGSDEAVEFARQNINAGEIRDLMRRAREAGFECTDCGGDVLRFTRRAAGATPPPAAANAADNIARADAEFAEQLARNGGLSGDIPGYSSAYNPELTTRMRNLDELENAERNLIKSKYSGIQEGEPLYNNYMNEMADVSNRYDAIRVLEYSNIAPLNPTAVQTFAEKMADNVTDILQNNIRVSRYTPQFESLNSRQMQDLAQEMVNQLSARYGIPQGKIKVQYTEIGSTPGVYNNGVLTISKYSDELGNGFEGGIHTLDGFGGTIAHEFTHAVDELAPEYGVLGAQRANIGNMHYTNAGVHLNESMRGLSLDDADLIYKLNYTEQVAHPVGNTTANRIRNTL